MLLIIDGMRHTGKSTAIRELVPRLSLLLPTHSFRWRPDDGAEVPYWARLKSLPELAASRHQLWVADRSYGSEFVYNQVNQRPVPFTDWLQLDGELAKLHTFHITTFISAKTTTERVAKTGVGFEGNPEEVSKLWNFFNSITQVPTISISGEATPEDFQQKIFFATLRWIAGIYAN